MADNKQDSGGSVFISYSRKDKTFVKKLNDALDNAGIHAWVDWEGIEIASDWMERITAAIQESDAFIFVISPDSLKSKVCAEELALSIQYNKKLIPILYREPEKRTKMPEKIAATNWVYMRKEDNFKEALPKLIEAINTDLNWVRQHTQLLGQALEWEKKNKNNSFLLTGAKLEEAERWLAEASSQKNRQVLPLQAEYISTSRIIATRNQRRLTITMSLLVVAALVFGIFALLSRNQANAARIRAEQSEATAVSSEATAVWNEQIAATQKAIAEQNEKEAVNQTNLARAQRSAAQAQIFQNRAGELDTSTLLAIDSYQRNPSPQAENLIRMNLSMMATPVAQMSQDGAIWNIEWSPDYEYFVTGNSTDPTNPLSESKACVYRASDGNQLYCVHHQDDVTDALFSRDNKYLITASADRTVKFWNAADGKFIKELSFGGAVLDLDVSDEVLAIGREDNFLTLYYLNKPDLKPFDHEQASGVRSVKFSPDGVFLAFGLQNGDVLFWHANNNFFYNGPKHPRSSFVVLAFSPDNLWLVSGGGDSTARLTKRDGTPQHTVIHQDWVEGVAFGPDPSWYVTVSDDNIVRVIDTATGTERFRMSHANFVQRVTVSRDGQWIASTGYDRTARIWDSISGTEMIEIPLEAIGSAITFNPDATRLIVADEEGNISIWDISKLNMRAGYIEFKEYLHEVRFTPSGEYLIVNADDYTIRKIPSDQISQIKDGTRGEALLTTESLTYNTAISPDSKWVAAVEYDSENTRKNRGILVSIDGTTHIPLLHGGEVTGVAFTRDSKLVATSGADGLIWFWDVQTGKAQFHLDNGKDQRIHSLAISPTNGLAAVGLHDKINIWDVETRAFVVALNHAGDIVTLAFSSDGKWLATGSTDGTVILWKIEGKNITPHGNTLRLSGYPRILTFSPDQRWLAGGGSTSHAYLWDIATTQEMARIPHGNPVTGIAFSPNGAQLLTASRKVVRIWDLSLIPLVPTDKLITFACSHLITNFSLDTWATFFGDEPYRPLCPDLPVPR
ncbi:MAG TPA: TIR domain-containing protein [Anaerolineales bacterium]|nr:TIR domain-containing protein [Anaerolineales bacterium]